MVAEDHGPGSIEVSELAFFPGAADQSPAVTSRSEAAATILMVHRAILFPRLVAEIFFQRNIEVEQFFLIGLEAADLDVGASLRRLNVGNVKE